MPRTAAILRVDLSTNYKIENRKRQWSYRSLLVWTQSHPQKEAGCNLFCARVSFQLHFLQTSFGPDPHPAPSLHDHCHYRHYSLLHPPMCQRQHSHGVVYASASHHDLWHPSFLKKKVQRKRKKDSCQDSFLYSTRARKGLDVNKHCSLSTLI